MEEIGDGGYLAFREKVLTEIGQHLKDNSEQEVVKRILHSIHNLPNLIKRKEITGKIYLSGTVEKIKDRYSSELEQSEQNIRKVVESGAVTFYHYPKDEPTKPHAGIVMEIENEAYVRLKDFRFVGNGEHTMVWGTITSLEYAQKFGSEDLRTENAKELSLDELFD